MGKSLSQKTKKNYALADAMLCVGTCNALRSEMGKTGTEEEGMVE